MTPAFAGMRYWVHEALAVGKPLQSRIHFGSRSNDVIFLYAILWFIPMLRALRPERVSKDTHGAFTSNRYRQ